MKKGKGSVEEVAAIRPLDVWKWIGKGGKSKRVFKNGRLCPERLLAVFKDRLTYTFIMGNEVASIHFDRLKKEIFFKGHNIRNLELSTAQVEALKGLKGVLNGDSRGEPFLTEYEATLGELLADKQKGSKPRGRGI